MKHEAALSVSLHVCATAWIALGVPPRFTGIFLYPTRIPTQVAYSAHIFLRSTGTKLLSVEDISIFQILGLGRHAEILGVKRLTIEYQSGDVHSMRSLKPFGGAP